MADPSRGRSMSRDADEYAQAVPRCPRCNGTAEVERSRQVGRGWLCHTCSLVFAGTQAEREAEARKRAADAQWAKGQGAA